MKFSTRAEYGLKAMANLAKDFPRQKTVRDISKEEKISAKYLERLMGWLRNKNLVQSHKGKSGGYILARNPAKIKVGEIVEILEGPISPMGCVGKICALEHKCSSSFVWAKVGVQIKETLYAIKLSDLIYTKK
ncbi:MAG: Rrf2 family transcriptional regulator [Candidatus Moranbacteria bacterium CG_4_9_14_3_um_filter_42_9]|nr:MAG: Rrf2 family transcriptional regulator [Candidatus Moranbacteria bacterium CG_4_9_14_3_um_filter_42_9]